MRELEKLDRLPPYVFTEVNRIKDSARAKGKDIIDFGMGNPDIPTPKHIVDKLVETSLDPKMHRYSASRGISGLPIPKSIMSFPFALAESLILLTSVKT